MKVARIHEHGGPEVLRYEDAPDPQIKANQILVRVRACALNHLDLFVRAGIPGMKFSMPHVLGSDIAGEVVAVGDLCERVKPGMRVLLSPGVSCRQCAQCASGNDNLCRRFTMFGYGIDGGNAELLAAPEWTAIPIPESLGFEQAAAVPLVFLTAWHMLFGRARLQPGEDVLVLAASSGVGSAAIQLAKLFQCRVIATAGGEAKLADLLRPGRGRRGAGDPAGRRAGGAAAQPLLGRAARCSTIASRPGGCRPRPSTSPTPRRRSPRARAPRCCGWRSPDEPADGRGRPARAASRAHASAVRARRWTTRSPRRCCSARSSSAPTSPCTARRSTSAATRTS